MQKIDYFQRGHSAPGFLYGVIKKYGEDNGSYLSSIITYYGLLSLFPVLIVFTSLTQLILKNNASLRVKVGASVAHYFPIIGNQLEHGIHDPKKTGLALIISLIITFYGARGGASAFQYAVNTLWRTPKTDQPGFPKNTLRSLGIILSGGGGLIIAAILSGYTADLGHGFFLKIVATLLSLLILWGTFIVLFKLAVAGHKRVSEVALAAIITAVGIQVLQTIGSEVLAHELKTLNNIYGTFALVVGLLFWINLQAQIALYSVEVQAVSKGGLYPRSLQGKLTEGDKAALAAAAKAMKQHADEIVTVNFRRKLNK